MHLDGILRVWPGTRYMRNTRRASRLALYRTVGEHESARRRRGLSRDPSLLALIWWMGIE
jgi:hypothetical protein